MAEFLTFAYQTGGDGVEVRVQDGTIWLSQKNMGALFEASPDNIGLHLKNIFKDGELSEKATAEDLSVVQSEGLRKVERAITYYNLDAIIAVGYRVNSKRATAFRQWATGVLRDYTLLCYFLNCKRGHYETTGFSVRYHAGSVASIRLRRDHGFSGFRLWAGIRVWGQRGGETSEEGKGEGGKKAPTGPGGYGRLACPSRSHGKSQGRSKQSQEHRIVLEAN
ncbi:MAG: virulence RhuM family protein [Candidatus Adiutrix sp.]|nr:virulence RhuM family protein [Candidatus Adiutrix sp.]